MRVAFIRNLGGHDLSRDIEKSLSHHEFRMRTFHEQNPLPGSIKDFGRLKLLKTLLLWYREQWQFQIQCAKHPALRITAVSRLIATPLGFIVSSTVKMFGGGWKDFFVAQVVTQKHMEAIWLANESSEDLLVLESDAWGDEVVLERLPRVLAELESSGVDYANLAGGFDISRSAVLRAGHNLSGLWSAEPSQSATSCAYFMSSHYCKEFAAQLALNPELSMLGIDHLHNKMLRVLNLKSFHFFPPVLEHGSVTGKVPSWRKD